MKRFVPVLVALAIPTLAIAGPISKWDDREPDFDYQSRANLHDVERCIIDTDGWPMPMVYRQPDRPDRVTIMYMNDVSQGAGRIDLIAKDGLLHIKGWRAPKAITSCAPPT